MTSSVQNPSVSVTHAPLDGTSSELRGLVSGINPTTSYIAAYAYIEQSGWWSVAPLSLSRLRIATDGSWQCTFLSSDSITLASQIQVFVLPDSIDPPYLKAAKSLPGFLYSSSSARKHVIRDSP